MLEAPTIAPREDVNDVPLTVIQPDVVPTVDAEKPVATYPDWKREDTKIVTYTIGNNVYRGTYADTREAALAHCEAIHGRVLEANYVQGRAFFRVYKVKP